MSDKFKYKSKWGKLLSKSDKGDHHFKLNEDVVDFLKPSTEKYPGEGTRQLAGPRIDVAVAQRWPEAGEVRKGSDSTGTGGTRRGSRKKNLSVKFVRTPPEVIGEGGEEALAPTAEISRTRTVVLGRSKTERRLHTPVTPVLDMKLAEAHRHDKSTPNSAPVSEAPRPPMHEQQPQQHRHHHSLVNPPTHPSQHRFFDPSPPLEPVEDEQDAPRPGIKRTATAFSSLEFDDEEARRASPINDDYREDDDEDDDDDDDDYDNHDDGLPTIVAPDSPVSPPISANPELSQFLQDSPPLPRSFPARVQARQSQLRAEEGRVLRRLSRLEFDESIDPRRPPSPNSPPRQTRRNSRDRIFTEPRPLVIPSGYEHEHEHERGHDHDNDNMHLSASPDLSPPSLSAPKTREQSHPLPNIPIQHSAPQIPPITTQDIDISHYDEIKFSPSDYRPKHRHSPSDSQPSLRLVPSAASLQPQQDSHQVSSSQTLRQMSSTASLQPGPPLRQMPSTASLQPYSSTFSRPIQPSGQHHPLPPTPNRGPSPSYFSVQAPNPNGLTPGLGLTPGPGLTPSQAFDPYGRSASVASQYRVVSPSDVGADSAEYAACSDFGSRVAHMRGVFRLTAERERPVQTITPRQWLRAAIWWLHKGRAGLTAHIKNTPKSVDGHRAELLIQAHVDVAKTWWILTDVLGNPDSPQSKVDSPQDTLKRDTDIARASLRSFTLSMSRNNIMPPHQSLIQGQDTTMWIEYPRFASDVASLLRGNASKSLVIDEEYEEVNPLDALPLGDTRDTFCYSRMFVNASINTEEADSDRVILPCVLTMMRGKSDYQTKVVISSQMDLVNMVIKPGDGGYGKGPTWHDVTWKTRLHGIYVRLPRGFSLNIEFQESDFRALWNMVEYTKKVNASMKPEADERLVHEARLVELQHSDSSNPHAFPKDSIRSCTGLLFEKRLLHHNGAGDTKIHRGYRLLLFTNPVNKTLSMANLVLCNASPLLFESSTANEPPAMVIHTQDGKRQCRSNLVFKTADERQDLYDMLQGISMGPEEQMTTRVTLRNLVIETSMGTETVAGAFKGLRWRDLRVVSEATDDASQDPGDMTLSEHFRLVAMHDGGGVTDRLNLGPGELLVRVAANNTPSISLLRAPQEDMTVSMDTRKTQQQLSEGLIDLVQTASKTPTIRTLTFPSYTELHLFQKALTRYTVRYDAPASLFAISRRRMVVPIYKKWEATKVRIQILTLGNITKIAAFFEDFSHVDAMVFQIKSTDTFEKAKGDKPAKFCVKFVDAKFSLPKKEKEGKDGADSDNDELPSDTKVWGKGVRRRFINMEGLEYAGEHDDITIGFEAEEDRDKFCEGLPAATTIKSMINLKRRI